MNNGNTINEIEKQIGYKFQERKLCEVALTHSSFANETAQNGASVGKESVDHYERLEFLGDAVLELAISDLLIRRFPRAEEGELTRLRSGLVNSERLATLAIALGLPGALRLGRGEESSGGRNKASILAAAFEALMAAVYLDGGFDAAFQAAAGQFKPLIDSESPFELLDDCKTPLQEKVQARMRTTPNYRVVSEEGPDHCKTFEVELIINGRAFARGRGKSKKEAEQDAARQALQSGLFEEKK
jgi:ribonuclease III